jgi:AcrR family transcriptional regulator
MIKPSGYVQTKQRDRGRTQAAILVAAKAVLAESGFQGFGVNAVARRAGCDKQLIYRYFGGIDGLVERIGRDLADWVTASLSIQAAGSSMGYGLFMERVLLSYVSALRADPLVQKIAAWEIAETTPLVAQLARSRSQALADWIARERGVLAPPDDIDAPAINAVLIAALQHLVLSSAATGAFAGMSLAQEADWERVSNVTKMIVRRIYGQA